MGPVLAEYRKQFTALALCKRGHSGCFLVEITFDLGSKKIRAEKFFYDHKPVSSLMGSEAPF